jgi:hypothetical protein
MKILRKIFASIMIILGMYLQLYSNGEWSLVLILLGSFLYSKGFFNEKK